MDTFMPGDCVTSLPFITALIYLVTTVNLVSESSYCIMVVSFICYCLDTVTMLSVNMNVHNNFPHPLLQCVCQQNVLT